MNISAKYSVLCYVIKVNTKHHINYKHKTILLSISIAVGITISICWRMEQAIARTHISNFMALSTYYH